MKEKMAKGRIKSTIEAHRWARSDISIKELAFQLDLKCTIERDTSFLREHIRFTVEGDENDLIVFKKTLVRAVQHYNE